MSRRTRGVPTGGRCADGGEVPWGVRDAPAGGNAPPVFRGGAPSRLGGAQRPWPIGAGQVLDVLRDHSGRASHAAGRPTPLRGALRFTFCSHFVSSLQSVVR